MDADAPPTVIGLNPFEPGFYDDPYRQYAEIQATRPIHKSDLGPWLVTRWDDVHAVLRKPGTSVEDVLTAIDDQPGGASATLRRLVEAARRHAERADPGRDAREATYRFMSATAGDLPGFEEASRALFAGAFARLAERIADWPRDVRTHVAHLAARAEAAAAETGSESPPV